jgi:hypothetical protein
MALGGRNPMEIHRSAETAFVHAAKEKYDSCEHLVAQATNRIRRSQGKLLVALVLIDRARRTALPLGHFPGNRNRRTERPWQPSA